MRFHLFGPAHIPVAWERCGCRIAALVWNMAKMLNAYLADFSRNLTSDEHALMVLDRAGWHQSKSLNIPSNVTLLYLPPYSPELNPAELLWWQARDKKLANQAFDTIPILEEAVANAWLWLIENPDSLRSLCLFPWIESAIFN